MAPPPEYVTEPKAPDKTGTNISNEDTKLLHSLVTDQHANSDHKPSNATSTTEAENKHVETLDDGQLRALLDEAITYKCPKDREGKSSLFKELLEEVEQDEQACEEAARSLCARRGTRSRRALAHSNSLQDLVAALAAEQAPRRATRHTHHHANVSARAIHGGSLPSGVDTSSLSEEPARGGYLATVRCVNPPPLAERRVSASDANGPAETEPLNRRSKPMFPMTYTARATLEIGSGSVCSGRAVTTTTPSNQVDSAISFSCITTPEVVATCNTTSSTSPAAVVVDPKPLQLGSSYRAVASVTGAEPPPPATPSADHDPGSGPATASDPAPAPTPMQGPSTPLPSRAQPRCVISSTFNGLPLSRPTYGATPSAGGDDYKKSLDENGNSVQGFSSPVSGSSQHKKPRRKKSTKNETVIDCQQIDGYQGDKDVNELLRFIESNAEHGRGAKLGRVKHKDDADDKGGKKRSTERRKDKETKIKRATSMEELSRTKIEDLTDGEPPRPERERRADHAPAKAERRSWGDDAREARDAQPPSAAELTDFQTVTKKRKPRRRPDEPARRARPPSPRARRESAPPSDRSNDSNDDLDSVHSLPDAPKAAPAAAPAAPAPHASYADIARTRHNIPDLIESCNFYAEAGAPRRAPAVPDDYPALERRRREAAAGAQLAKGAPAAVRRDRKERPPVAVDAAEPSTADCPAPDVVADRRPPVVLLDSAARPRDMDGVTFGFDINEQLLGDAGGRPRCDLLRDAVAEAGAGAGAGHAVRVGCRALRYVPPGASPHTTHLLQIVDYVGSAWEEVVRCGTGKVRYFSE